MGQLSSDGAVLVPESQDPGFSHTRTPRHMNVETNDLNLQNAFYPVSKPTRKA